MTWGPVSPSPEQETALKELSERRARGEISAFEFESRKKQLLAGSFATMAVEAPKPVAATAAAPAEPAPSPAPAEPKPAGWGAQDSTPKSWSAGPRAEDPGRRTVHAPLASGAGDGKAFLFLFGLKKHSPMDRDFLARELEGVADDIETLRKNGFTVVLEKEALRQDFLDAVAGRSAGATGLEPAGIYWSAHGYEDGSIETSDGGKIKPDDCDPAQVSKALKLVVFGSCYVGSRARTWRQKLGGTPLVVGWGRPVTIDRAVEFLTPHTDTETDFDDLVNRFLLEGEPIPPEPSIASVPVSSPSASGRRGPLADRVKAIAERLGAMWRDLPQGFELSVPQENDRRQPARLFVVDCRSPHAEGEPLVGAESEVGEMSSVVDPVRVLSAASTPGYARVSLVAGESEAPRLVVSAYLPLARSRDADIASLIWQVTSTADRLEREIFGGDLSR